MELAVHLVQRTRQRLVGDRCLWLLTAHNTFDANVFHQSGNGTAGDIKSFPAHLMPDLANAIDAQVFFKDTLNLGLQFFVTFCAIRKA